MTPPPLLATDVLRQCHARHAGRHGSRLAVFVLCYLAGAVAAISLGGILPAPWHWLAVIPFQILAAASLHGISLFTHEAVHGTLSSNSRWNAVAGALCAWPVMQNFTAYRVLHLQHHRHLGAEGDPDHYANYTRWSWMVFLMNWLRLLIGYPVYIVMIPILGFKQGTARDRLGILAELTALAAAAWLAWTFIPSAWLWQAWVIPMIAINFMVNLRGMSQHTLLEQASDEIQGTRSILTKPLVAFFMCNENLHLEHHLYPGVPWHGLPQLHAALEPSLRKQGAPYIRSYSAFLVEFVRGSFQRSPWGRNR